MTTEEGNKLIAEFMGFTPRTDLHTKGALFMQAPIIGKATHSACYIVDKSKDEFDEFITLEYHSSWDWLMPVVEKIVHAACELPTIELRKEAMKKYDLIQDQLCNFIITGVHFYAVQFITWYNSTPHPKQINNEMDKVK